MVDYVLILYVGLALFFASMLLIIWRIYKDQKSFVSWLESNHPQEFHRLVYEDGPRKFFSPPWRKGTIAYFIGSSEEDLGDPKIKEFRTKLRWHLYSFIITGIAAMIYFAMIAWWLEYVVRP